MRRRARVDEVEKNNTLLFTVDIEMKIDRVVPSVVRDQAAILSIVCFRRVKQ